MTPHYVVTRGTEQPPDGATLVYEGEWNEGAPPEEQRSAMEYFVRDGGLPELPFDIPTVGEDDALWIVRQRCEERARKGTGEGVCDRVADTYGQCDRASDHLEATR